MTQSSRIEYSRAVAIDYLNIEEIFPELVNKKYLKIIIKKKKQKHFEILSAYYCVHTSKYSTRYTIFITVFLGKALHHLNCAILQIMWHN